ncbi:ABC transporter ATP-binding protein [Castellaniella sp.]|uniref:ABC transporter ATP-binding protein n=1 Tax=Castellaniella sp. TaxID=1955812 RepID=UPI00356451F6
MIQAKGIYARIGSIEVLSQVDLHVARGEMLAVIGANGAGKTSLLRTLSNIIIPEKGEIHFDGKPTRGKQAHELARMGLVHVPQGRQIIPNLSVRDNLLLGTHYLNLPADEKSARLEKEFERFPVLKAREGISGGALSGGEQQMLAVSRGLMMGPKVLMLDEPSLGLAPKIVHLILQTLNELKAEGLSVILVEQAAVLALEYSDRGLVLRNGKVVVESDSVSLRNSQALVDGYLT